MRYFPDRRSRNIDPNSERFSDSIKNIVRSIQHGKSIITQEPIVEFHHLRGKGKNCNQVDNCVGVGVVAHALIHYWQWTVTGVEDEWNAFEGQRQLFNDQQKIMFKALKDDEKLSIRWKEGYIDQVEMTIRGKPNVYYI